MCEGESRDEGVCAGESRDEGVCEGESRDEGVCEGESRDEGVCVEERAEMKVCMKESRDECAGVRACCHVPMFHGYHSYQYFSSQVHHVAYFLKGTLISSSPVPAIHDGA